MCGMKHVFAIPLGMLAGFFVGTWLTGYTVGSKTANADFQTLVLLAFVAAGGIASAALVSSRWWDRRKK
jgi:hypothetical protein